MFILGRERQGYLSAIPLVREGVEIDCTESVTEAEEKLKSAAEPYDIIIVRKNLGHKDDPNYRDSGFRFASKIRSGKLGSAHQDTKIAIQTRGLWAGKNSMGEESAARLERNLAGIDSVDVISSSPETLLWYLVDHCNYPLPEAGFLRKDYEREKAEQEKLGKEGAIIR